MKTQLQCSSMFFKIVNSDKTNCMLICTSQRRYTLAGRSLSIKLNGKSIQCVHEHKILGVILDQGLKFDAHVDMLCSKLSQLCYLLRCINQYLTPEARKLFYNSYVQSSLTYCICTWGLCSLSNLNRLYAMQKRVCRILLNDYISDSVDVIRNVGVLTIHEQVEFNILCLVYSCQHNLTPRSLSELFQSTVADSRQGSLRNSTLKLNVPFPRTETRKRAISYAGSVLWNNLPLSLRLSPNLGHFKHGAKAHILAKRTL